MVPVDDSLELWGGIECTVNRVRDEYLDQLELSGHATRTRDLLLLADLDLGALRYPLLWERTVKPNGSLDFSWADERLGVLKELDVEPIVGLVHHGSGPRHTSLLDPAFGVELARYAERVAQRYPWL